MEQDFVPTTELRKNFNRNFWTGAGLLAIVLLCLTAIAFVAIQYIFGVRVIDVISGSDDDDADKQKAVAAVVGLLILYIALFLLYVWKQGGLRATGAESRQSGFPYNRHLNDHVVSTENRTRAHVSHQRGRNRIADIESRMFDDDMQQQFEPVQGGFS